MRIPKIAGFLSILAISLVMVECDHAVKPVGGSPVQASEGASQRYRVAMLEFHFRPESLNVSTGYTVTWVNKGRLPHTTTSGISGTPDGLWDTKHLARGESFSYVFSQPGTYRYFCRPHHGLGMKGVVVVTNLEGRIHESYDSARSDTAGVRRHHDAGGSQPSGRDAG